MVKLNNREYNVKEARTEEERRIGLSNVDKLEKDEGMLFFFDYPQDVSFTMKDTSIPLDIIFIDEGLEVISVKKGVPHSSKPITEQNVMYVLEVNRKSGASVGDYVDFNEEPVMDVLSPDGTALMQLWGGERIFRRAFTKQLINLVKRANELKIDEEQYGSLCRRIGRKMFKELKQQDSREPEYVLTPNLK